MKRLAAILAFSAIAFSSSKVLADSNTLPAVPSALFSSTTSSDFSSLFAGYVVVSNASYYWGGSYCSSIIAITSTQFQILSDAVINKKIITVFYKLQGSNRCITGFAVTGTTGVVSK